MKSRILNLLTVLFAVLGPAVFAQSGNLFDKAPPDVEKSLRARVTAFYDLMMTHKFRQAESFVCEDGKDTFYNGPKIAPNGVKLGSITWMNDFQSARVVTVQDRMLRTLNGEIPAKAPIPTLWRRDGDSWCMYYMKSDGKGMETPFGRMGVTYDKDSPSDNQNKPLPRPMDAKSLGSGVTVAVRQVTLSNDKPNQAVIPVENHMAGSVTVQLMGPDMPGLVFEPETDTLHGHTSLPIKVRYTPPEGEHFEGVVTARVHITPLAMTIPVRILIGPPAK